MMYNKPMFERERRNRVGQLLLVIALLWMPLTQVQAQDGYEDDMEEEEVERYRVLKVNPFQLGDVSLSYEKMRTNRISNEIAFSYIYRSFLQGDGGLPEDVRVQGAGIRMSQRKYSNKASGKPYGFFHGFVFGYRFMAFEEGVFGLPEHAPGDPDYRLVGRLYQNSLDLSYQLGVQFRLSEHLTAEAAGALGARAKYALAKNAGALLTDNIIGHALVAEDNSAVFVVPAPQLILSVGYAF
ncbi:ABC transporter ATP-binding protein [Pontibacter russatus]|uniref:ABC transporter ATP-binding protein n=1 Tax=Pontibacter russatus TaxID=2694929 RepID=UPI00137A927F|nr:ABC transporter ATP-binding protein [Pontibacter russatus]